MISNLRNPECTFKAILIDENINLNDGEFVVFTDLVYSEFAKIIMDEKLREGISLPFDIIFVNSRHIYAATLNYYDYDAACISYFELIEVENDK